MAKNGNGIAPTVTKVALDAAAEINVTTITTALHEILKKKEPLSPDDAEQEIRSFLESKELKKIEIRNRPWINQGVIDLYADFSFDGVIRESIKLTIGIIKPIIAKQTKKLKPVLAN
jgi:hypothetical protein